MIRKLVVVAVSGVAALAALPAQAAISRGPWVQDATPTSITIAWEAGFGSGSTQLVNWGAGTALDQGTTGAAFNGSTSVFTAHITGLSPSTSYSYKVTSGSDLSGVATFVTAPDHAEPFRFVDYGDNRSDATAHAQVVAGIVQAAPDFAINTGDMALIPLYTEFFQIEAPLISKTPIFPVPGNHDGVSSAYTNGFARPNYYSFKWANAYYIAVSTEDSYATGSTQYNWVKNELIAAKADPAINWIFVYHHYPVYSSSTHGSTAALQGSLNDLYKQYGVDIVFNGHDHDYERSEADGVVYVVEGGGGAPLYPAGTTCTGHVISQSVQGFATVDIDGGTLHLKAYSTDGVTNTLIDSRDITKSVVPTPTPTSSATPVTSGTPTPNPTDTPGGDGANGGHGGCSVADGSAMGGIGGAFAGFALVGLLVARRRRTA